MVFHRTKAWGYFCKRLKAYCEPMGLFLAPSSANNSFKEGQDLYNSDGSLELFFCGQLDPISEDELPSTCELTLGSKNPNAATNFYVIDIFGPKRTNTDFFYESESMAKITFSKNEPLGISQPFFENFLVYWDYDTSDIARLDYNETAKSFGVDKLDQNHYDELGKKHPIIILTNHTIHTLPHWSMDYDPDSNPITFKKHSVLINGVEMLTGADMSTDIKKMYDMFYGPYYKEKRDYLYNKYGSAFVQNKFSRHLSNPIFPQRMKCELNHKGVLELMSKYITV